MARKPIPPYKPLTGAHPVKVRSSVEPTAVYTLDDGTVIKARLRVHSFFRWPGQFDIDGNPVYSSQTMIHFEVVAPNELKQP